MHYSHDWSMRSTVWVILSLLMIGSPIYAITDKEVLAIAMTMAEEGKSETDIAKALFQKGATLKQLEQLQNQVQNSSSIANLQLDSKEETPSLNRENNTVAAEIQRKKINYTSKVIFGHDFFEGEEGQYVPSLSVATPHDYVLGTGDNVIINIFGASQKSISAEITPDGYITIEEYGPIHISGMTIATASRLIKSTLGARFQNSQIMLSLGQTRSIMVHVMGEVAYPGNYQITAFVDVLYALYMAGGIRTTGTLRNIKIYRENKLVSTIDLYEYLMDGSLKQNVRLQDGDVILVGTYSELVQIKGQVKRPLYYEMLPHETIHNLLYYAGGFKGDAYTDAVRVMRRNTESGFSTHTVANEQFSNFRLLDGDSVSIEAILDRPQNTLEILGAIFRPGFYGLSGNLHTVKQLVETAQGPDEQAIPERAVLYRIQSDRTYKTIQLNIAAIINGTAPDMELQNEDRIFIPSRTRQLDHFQVTIHGEVYEPGQYPYSENESVDNLILRAGGLTDKASTSKIHVIRHLINPSATKEPEKNTQLFTLSLEDTVSVRQFMLQPYDEVYIRITPAYAPNQNVQIRGEVVYDGTYALKTKSDRISSLIEAAGGLTKYAYPEGARLVRTTNELEKRSRQQLLKINKAASSLESIDAAKLDIGDYYSVAIDLPAALAHPGSLEDFILRDGDIIIIPTITTTVHISGEVLFPNTIYFSAGKNARYYINQAGGYSNLARKSKAYVIYPNGKVAKASTAKIMPGSEIVIPSKPEKVPMTPTQWIGIASASASLASVAATLATLIINATKK